VKKSITRLGACGLIFLTTYGIAVSDTVETRTLRIVDYNIQADTVGIATPGIVSPTCGLILPYNGPGGTYTTNCSGSVTNGGVLEGMGEEIINGDPAQPIDILALEETTSNATTVQPIVDALNAFYAFYSNGAGYAMSPYQATQEGGTNNTGFGNGPNAMVYNTNTVQLIASVGVGTPTGSIGGGGNGEYRQVVRYEFAPAGVAPGTNNEFYIYVSHYKASTGVTNALNRLGEAMIIRDDEAENLPANARVLYVGDYNPDNTFTNDWDEPAYLTIVSNSAPNGVTQGQGIDPLNVSGSTNIDWSDPTTNASILFMLSEESYELRYRDDMQIMTSNVYYGVSGGLQYVPGTYHSFGNNASLPYGSSANSVSNTALNDLDPALTNLTGLSAGVLLEDLTGASDHLPIVADYTISYVLPSPVAGFSASPRNGTAPLNVSFTDLSSGSVTGWAWAFGDGNTSSNQSPMHTYTRAGSYSVEEIVSGPGGEGTNVQSDYIVVGCPVITLSPGGGAPTVLPSGTLGAAYDEAITATNGIGPYTYAATSGTMPAGLNLSSGGVLSGTPTVAGVYTFTVTATDSAGCAGSQEYSVTTTCTGLTFSPTSQSVPGKGGSKKVKVAGGGCAWIAESDDPELIIDSGSIGTGEGQVVYTVLGNTNGTGVSRTMTIGGEIFTVNQEAGGCRFRLSPKRGKFKAAGGAGTVKVKVNFGDCPWTAGRDEAFSFITVTNAASGVGDGTVSYTIAPNTSPEERDGSLEIGGEVFLISQEGVKQ